MGNPTYLTFAVGILGIIAGLLGVELAARRVRRMRLGMDLYLGELLSWNWTTGGAAAMFVYAGWWIAAAVAAMFYVVSLVAAYTAKDPAEWE